MLEHTRHRVRILPPGDGRPTHFLTAECGQCGSPMRLAGSKVEGQSRWAETSLVCPTCTPRQEAIVRWEAAGDPT